MSTTKYVTHKSTKAGRETTLARRRARSLKRGVRRLDVVALTAEITGGQR